MTPTSSKSASERAALVREAREMAAYYRAYDTTWPADMLDRLADALEAADKDTQRLDWLATNVCEIDHFADEPDSWCFTFRDSRGFEWHNGSFRNAIDAARDAEETGR